MPERHPSARPYPGTVYTLHHAAESGQLVIVRCNGCKRSVTYLAADLERLLDPRRPADDPPFPCSKCGTKDYMRVTIRTPALGDYGSLVIRRPGRVKTTQLWRTVKLGDQ